MKSYRFITVTLLSAVFAATILPVSAAELSTKQINSIKSTTQGRILLQVEDSGKAWYVSPTTLERYYLGTPEDAFAVIRSQGIGITQKDLEKIQPAIPYHRYMESKAIDFDQDGLSDDFEEAIRTNSHNINSDGDWHGDFQEVDEGYNPQGNGEMLLDKKFTKKHLGKIFIDVSNKGRAWYVNPVDQKRHYLGKSEDAYNIMRKTGLGITNDNLSVIPISQYSKIPKENKSNTIQTSFIKILEAPENLIYITPEYLDCGSINYNDSDSEVLMQFGTKDAYDLKTTHMRNVAECVTQRSRACQPTTVKFQLQVAKTFKDYIKTFFKYEPSYPISIDYDVRIDILGMQDGLCHTQAEFKKAEMNIMYSQYNFSNTTADCKAPLSIQPTDFEEGESEFDEYCTGNAVTYLQQNKEGMMQAIDNIAKDIAEATKYKMY